MTDLLKKSKIVVTREAKQATSFSEEIIANGGKPLEVPLLKISCMLSKNNIDTLRNIEKYNWIFFTSANGVHCFFKQLESLAIKHEVLDSHQFAVVGHKTELALKEYQFQANFIPSIYNAETMAREFMQKHNESGPLLLVQGSLSRPILFEELRVAHYEVDCLNVYQTEINKAAKHQLHKTLQADIQFITFMSPSTVDAFMTLISEPIHQEIVFVFVCVGTTTAKRARELGLENILIPEQFTIEGMITTMGKFLVEKGSI